MQKILHLLLALTLALAPAAGCTQKAPTAPKVAVPAPAEQTPSPTTEAPRPEPEAAELPVATKLPSDLRRVILEPGQAVTETGLYFMDVTTGKLEGWLPPLAQHGEPAYHLWTSDDERWITATMGETGYLIRRKDGAAFSYNPQRLRLTFGPGVILVQPQAWKTGITPKCSILNEQGELLSTYGVQDEVPCTTNHQALFSPDGKVLAIAYATGGAVASLVDVATGAKKALDQFRVPTGFGLDQVFLAPLTKQNELVVLLPMTRLGSVPQTYRTRVQRYAWDGKLRSEMELEGYSPKLSPDGKLVLYHQSLGTLGESAVVQEWGNPKPLFRVTGGFNSEWLANSKEFLTHTSQSYQLVTTTGEMKVAAPTASEKKYRPNIWLRPAPDNAELFLTGGAMKDRAGKTQRELRLEGKGLWVQQWSWGPTAKSAHFLVRPQLGKGWEPGPWYWIAPKVQRPPFQDKFPLMVKDPGGDCLNLREEPSQGGKVVRCLATGARLTMAAPDQVLGDMRWDGDAIWLKVATEAGETGWVGLHTGSVTYAD